MYITFLYLLLTSCIQEKYSEYTMPEFDYAQEGQDVGDIVFKTRFLDRTQIQWLPDNSLLFKSGIDDITPEGRRSTKLEIWYPDTNKRLLIEKPYDLFSEEKTDDIIPHIAHDVRFCDTKPFNNIIETHFHKRAINDRYKERNNTYRYYQYDPMKRSIKKVDLPDYYRKLECSDSYYKNRYEVHNLVQNGILNIPSNLEKYIGIKKYHFFLNSYFNSYSIIEKSINFFATDRFYREYSLDGSILSRSDTKGSYSPYAQSYVSTHYNKKKQCINHEQYHYDHIESVYDKVFLCHHVNDKNTYFTDVKNYFLQYQDGLVSTTSNRNLDRRQARKITQISTINFNGELNHHRIKGGFRLNKRVNVSPDGCHVALTGSKTLIIYKLCEQNSKKLNKT